VAEARSAPIVDIGILTIREDEFRAVLDELPEKAGIHRGRREYTLRRADGGDEITYTVAVLRQIEQGNGEAQDAARDLLDDLNPALLLVVGIAGGLPSDDLTLGDVVLSTRVNDYCVEARKARSKATYDLSGGPIDKRLAAGVANLAGREELGDWTSGLPERPRVEWTRPKQLYGPPNWRRELTEKLEAHFGAESQPRSPIFMSGPIASSDRLIKDPEVLFPWIETARHLFAVEMESGGVYRAARERCPMLAIRGISDLVGLKRNERWTGFACKSAAAFTRAYLRTSPVPPKSSREETPRAISGGRAPAPKTASMVDVAAPPLDTLYANLVPLLEFPRTIYVAPATFKSYKQAWAKLFRGTDDYVSRAWALHNKCVYSFVDPTESLEKIIDPGGVEAHETRRYAEAEDRDERALFVWLLNGALRDDLDLMDVWYFHHERLYAFAGKRRDGPRTYRYQNVRVPSTMTVVSHYTQKSKDGRSFPYMRHLACNARFRLLGGKWFLEVNPTYRFTTDGVKKYRFHEDQLSGIKRLEGNRAVLSQVLAWNHVLRTEPPEERGTKLLKFGDVPLFRIERVISDDELSASGTETEGPSETEPPVSASK
jgi:nucleoside phosphorylase